MKTHFRHFPTQRAYFFLKLEFRFLFCFDFVLFCFVFVCLFVCFAVHCVVEASSFSLNHNLALESKQNSVKDPQKVQNPFVFIPEL